MTLSSKFIRKYLATGTRKPRIISSRTGCSKHDYLLGNCSHWREKSARRAKGKENRGGETICTSLKGVGGASGSSDPSPSAASRREKQFTLPCGLRITFECWRGALFLAVNRRDNEIPSDFRARLFALTRRDQFPFGEGILSSSITRTSRTGQFCWITGTKIETLRTRGF